MPFPDRAGVGPAADPALIVGRAAFQQLGVQILEVGHLGNRHQEIRRAKPTRPSTPPFSWPRAGLQNRDSKV